jgi:hypothetical protein
MISRGRYFGIDRIGAGERLAAMPAVAMAAGGNRDTAVIALVAAAHTVSHVMQLALPTLFPILHEEFKVGFTEIGIVAILFYAASGLGKSFAAGP